MKPMPKEALRYAILLIVLFTIATLTVRSILVFLETRLAQDHFHIVTILMFSLTLGFMMIAGAFGLWAVRFSSEAESRRRIGRFVDAMDYLSDGVLTLDAKGRITGSNPAALEISGYDTLKGLMLEEAFEGMPENEVRVLVSHRAPYECEWALAKENRVFRFRSQPSEGLNLIMISDVTAMNVQITRNRQAARLELIGQIARGVAYDINELLCTVSSQASLLRHLPRDSSDIPAAIDHIIHEADKGIALADHLRELAQPVRQAAPTDVCHEHLALAAARIRDSLSDTWTVETDLQPIPPVSFTGLQIEQIVINLALLCTDATRDPGVIRIEARPPGLRAPYDIKDTFAGVVLISTHGKQPPARSEYRSPTRESKVAEPGVILSVIRSMVQDAGGTLDSLQDSHGGTLYRVGLPFGLLAEDGRRDGTSDSHEIEAALAQASVLLALAPGRQRYNALKDRLKTCGADVFTVTTLMALLAHTEKDMALDAIIVDRALLGQEAESLLRAIIKLRPLAGVVVLGEPAEAHKSLALDIAFAGDQGTPDTILSALVKAKEKADLRIDVVSGT